MVHSIDPLPGCSLSLTSVRLTVPGVGRTRRVVHLTDMHFGHTTPVSVQEAAVEHANALEPDLIALTGDFVGRGLRFLPRVIRVLSALRAPRVAVLGNHDHWSGGDAVMAALELAGAVVLRNESLTMDGLTVVGLDDPVTRRHDPDAAVRAVGSGPRLGLSHDPKAAPTLWSREVPVVLAGHTHGGQVDLGVVTDRIHRGFVSGLHRDERGSVYVSPGVGSCVFPWRLGRRSQAGIALIELVEG